MPIAHSASIDVLEFKTSNLLHPAKQFDTLLHLKLSPDLTYGLFAQQGRGRNLFHFQTGFLYKNPVFKSETLLLMNAVMFEQNPDNELNQLDRVPHRFGLSTLGVKHQQRFLPDERLTLALESVYAPTARNPDLLNSMHARIAMIYRMPRPSKEEGVFDPKTTFAFKMSSWRGF